MVGNGGNAGGNDNASRNAGVGGNAGGTGGNGDNAGVGGSASNGGDLRGGAGGTGGAGSNAGVGGNASRNSANPGNAGGTGGNAGIIGGAVSNAGVGGTPSLNSANPGNAGGGNAARFRALILDMDGTTLDTERVLLKMWETAAREMGYIFAMDVMASTVGTTYAETLRMMDRAYPGAPHDGIRKEVSRRFQAARESGGIALRPGFHEIVRAARERGMALGICTSTRRASAEATLAAAGIAPLFDAMVCGGDTELGKPDPAPYLLAAERLGVQPGQCVAVEDSPSGARSALAAGMRVIVVPDVLAIPPDVAALAGMAADLAEAARLL
jgi:HAD superfamily hydrolase (TIGR01509 family)